MEENLIIENELYNSFHTQTHCCNLWLGQGRILALGFFFFLLMPSNSFRLSYATQQPPPAFSLLSRVSSVLFSFFHLNSQCSCSGPFSPPCDPSLSGRNNLQIVSVVFYEEPRFSANSRRRRSMENTIMPP